MSQNNQSENGWASLILGCIGVLTAFAGLILMFLLWESRYAGLHRPTLFFAGCLIGACLQFINLTSIVLGSLHIAEARRAGHAGSLGRAGVMLGVFASLLWGAIGLQWFAAPGI